MIEIKKEQETGERVREGKGREESRGGRKMERKERSKNESDGGREREDGTLKEREQGRETIHNENVRVCTECTMYVPVSVAHKEGTCPSDR